MVFASTAPPSTAAATCRRDFLLGIDLRLIGVIVDVVVALRCVERDRREEESTGYKYKTPITRNKLRFSTFAFD